MKSVKTLKNILIKLTKDEMKILIRSLNNINIEKKYRLKSLQLIKLLMSENELTQNEIQKNIYGKLNYNAFNKLTNRLRHRAYEIITLDISISSNNYSKRNKVNINLRKKLLQADILQLKGLRSNVLPIYNHIILNSKKFELYDIQIQALNSKQRLQSVNSKYKIFEKIKNEITNAETCKMSIKESSNIYNEITNIISNSDNYLSYSKDLTLSVDSLKAYYQNSKSPTIGFYYYTLSAELWENQSEYNKSKQCLQTVRKILLNNESAYTINRYGTTLLNLSNNCIFLYQFDDAILLANEAKKYFKDLPFTLLIVEEILFYSYFYKKEFENCKLILIENRLTFENALIMSKFNYYQSCLYFIVGLYNESLEGLLINKEIEKDKEGWNINIRILTIINRIELFQYESVDLQIQSLDRFIKRISKSKVVLPRYVIILRILTKLIQENYNFLLVYKKRFKYFEYLESNDIRYKWQIKSPELIIFQNWFRNKMNEQ